MIKRLLVYLFCIIGGVQKAQTDSLFCWPIDTSHVLTGNYGELRPNHFHMGLDFATSKMGRPVYAIADGYVSRIKVSSVGYGKALYITHQKSGKTSLYAHLSVYNPVLAKIVKAEQARNQGYEVEFFPDPDSFRVKKGELIGYSGNSGNSSGPHLHFEVRDTKTEVPLNPLDFFKISDTVKPTITHLGFYSLADTNSPVFIKTLPVWHKPGRFILKKDSITFDQPILGLAFSGFDQFVSRGNSNVPSEAELYLDSLLIYSHRLRSISFNDQRYVNEFSGSFLKVLYQKCFLPTCYPGGIYESVLNKGRIILPDTNYHLLELLVKDQQGNTSALSLHVKAKKLTGFTPLENENVMAVCTRDFLIAKNSLQLFIPAGALYNGAFIKMVDDLETAGAFIILPADQNLAVPATISLKIPHRFLKHKNQLILKNRSAYYIPKNNADSVSYFVYNLGLFQLLTDTLPPKIKPLLSTKKIKRLKKITALSFVVSDNLSGLGKYALFVNEVWALAEYDAKNHLLTYYFNDSTPSGNLSFRIEVEDKVANKTVLNYRLPRP